MNEEPLKNLSILLVEDNEMNTLLASSIIKRTGAIITEVDNGKDAIEELVKQSFDIVLMDLHMPVMNGFETTEYIRKKLALNIPIIAITANVINDEEKRCLESGMNGFISKPYTEKALLDKILWTLEKPGEAETHVDNMPAAGVSSLYNLSALRAITGSNAALLKKILTVFCMEVPAAIKDMKKAYAGKNLLQVSELAHSIKANIDSLEITSLKETIRKIESITKANTPGPELAASITLLEATIDIVVLQLMSNELS
ncbi:MAG: response regulator [Chitinophagaceae bacterium]|nr:response regulator [Chitinophagaceae bacterium]